MKNGRKTIATAVWVLLSMVLVAGLTGCGRKAGATKTFTLPGGEKIEMVWCPPGSFMMGSPETEEGRADNEAQRKVTLTKGFWLAKYEVTQKQWNSVIHSPVGKDNPSRHVGDDFPVENVTWEACVEFCWKAGLQLPTEAQWEYACRAGSTEPYAGSRELENLGWYARNSEESTHAVGQKQPNAWGLYDMHGNVWEWCDDWYGKYPTDAETDPTGPAAGISRVMRGGYFENGAPYCRSAYRGWGPPDDNMRFKGHVGFRPLTFSDTLKDK